MPDARNKLLRSLGLYLRAGFVAREQCSALEQLMRRAPAQPAEVYAPRSSAPALDERTRRTLSVDLSGSAAQTIERAFDALRSDLAAHFSEPLERCEPPDYLVYGPGAFFIPHRDRPRTPEDAPEAADRRVSAVIFVNAPRALDAGGYVGGDLNFFGLVDDPKWAHVGFGCDAAPGLLVAFRSNTLHEVTPVVSGHRCTIVTWYS